MDIALVLLLCLPLLALSINVSPKIDFGDQSPGISPDFIKKILEKEKEVSVSPGVVKATLEVNVGGLVSSSKPEAKSSEENKKGKKDKKKKKNQFLICTLDGNCKLHEVDTEESEEDNDEEGKKNLKPVLVTDFNVDPSKERHIGEGKANGKDAPDIPVIIGHAGAKDNDHPYYGGHSPPSRNNGNPYSNTHQRLPVYYGMKLSPEFYHPHPGPIIYEEHSHSSSYPYGHELSYLYESHEVQYPHAVPRTPTPYDRFKPSYSSVYAPPNRRVSSGTGWYWPSQQSGWNNQPGTGLHSGSSDRNNQPGTGLHSGSSDWNNQPGTSLQSGWNNKPGTGLHSGSSDWNNQPGTSLQSGWNTKPGTFYPSQGPYGGSSPPVVTAVRGKMDFDEDSPGGGNSPMDPSAGQVTVDGKLGEPLDENES